MAALAFDVDASLEADASSISIDSSSKTRLERSHCDCVVNCEVRVKVQRLSLARARSSDFSLEHHHHQHIRHEVKSSLRVLQLLLLVYYIISTLVYAFLSSPRIHHYYTSCAFVKQHATLKLTSKPIVDMMEMYSDVVDAAVEPHKVINDGRQDDAFLAVLTTVLHLGIQTKALLTLNQREPLEKCVF